MNGRDFAPTTLSPSFFIRCAEAASGDLGIMVELIRIGSRKKIKMVHALRGGNNAGHYNMQYLNGVRLELMPNILAFFQDCGKCSGTEERNLDTLFEVIRSSPGVTSFHSAH